jgi:hypothetical protein
VARPGAGDLVEHHGQAEGDEAAVDDPADFLGGPACLEDAAHLREDGGL